MWCAVLPCISDWLLLCAMRHPDGGIARDGCRFAGDYIALRYSMEIRYGFSPRKYRKNLCPLRRKGKRFPDIAPSERFGTETKLCLSIRWIARCANQGGCQRFGGRTVFLSICCYGTASLFKRTGVDSAERGTALHHFMQFCDFAVARVDPAQEKDRLVKQGFLSGRGEAVEIRRVQAFLLPLWRRECSKQTRSCREYRFTVEITAGEVQPGLPETLANEAVVMQGQWTVLLRRTANGWWWTLRPTMPRMKKPFGSDMRPSSPCTAGHLWLAPAFRSRNACCTSFFLNREIRGKGVA